MDIFIVSSGMLAIALILNLIGSVLKYRTGTPNELIAIALTLISSAIWCLIGIWKCWGLEGAAFWYGIFVENGLFLGLPTAAMAITGWDILHGVHKHRKLSVKSGRGRKKA